MFLKNKQIHSSIDVLSPNQNPLKILQLFFFQIRMRVSHYFVFLSDWLSVFPRDQFFITCLEDYASNKALIIEQMSEFLGLGES